VALASKNALFPAFDNREKESICGEKDKERKRKGARASGLKTTCAENEQSNNEWGRGEKTSEQVPATLTFYEKREKGTSRNFFCFNQPNKI